MQRSPALFVSNSKLSSGRHPVLRWSPECDANPRRRLCVPEQFRLIPILRKEKVHSPVVVKIRRRAAALAAKNFHAALDTLHGTESALGISFQKQTSPCIQAAIEIAHGQEILR